MNVSRIKWPVALLFAVALALSWRVELARELTVALLPDVGGMATRLALRSLDDSGQVYVVAQERLRQLGPRAVKPLSLSLASSDPHVRLQAAFALSVVGPPAAKALPNLMPLTSDANDEVREQVFYACFAISQDASQRRTLAVKAVGDRVPTVRHGGLQALAQLAPGGSEDVELLSPLVDDPESIVAAEACLALARLGALAEPALPRLRKQAASNACSRTRSLAEDAIATIEREIHAPAPPSAPDS